MIVEEDDLVRRAKARVGTTLKDRWTLDALLGVGGMASVYSATHRNGSHVAVKWLHPELALDKKMRERFVREGYIANKVSHAGVVTVLDDDIAEDGSLILFMELLDGETVEARARRTNRRLAIEEALWVGHELLEVVAAAHDASIIHRDLKPENLFVTRGGKLKVLDFGIARLRELSSLSGATGSQSSLGTPAFMPPEQARGRWQEVDARSDIWAIGATMFTLLAGRSVHEAGTVNEQLLAAMTEPAPPLLSVVPAAPAELGDLVDRALAFKAEDRWPDARSMRTACAKTFGEITGRSIADWSLPPPRDFDETLPFDERRSVFEAPAKIAPATLTTGRAVTSVLPDPAMPAPVAHADRTSRRRRAVAGALVMAGAAILTLAVAYPLRRHVLVPGADHDAIADGRTAESSAGPIPALDEPPPLPATSSSRSPAARSIAPRTSATSLPIAPPAAKQPPRIVHPPPAQSATARKPSCTPPYTVNAEGKKIWKVDCL